MLKKMLKPVVYKGLRYGFPVEYRYLLGLERVFFDVILENILCFRIFLSKKRVEQQGFIGKIIRKT